MVRHGQAESGEKVATTSGFTIVYTRKVRATVSSIP